MQLASCLICQRSQIGYVPPLVAVSRTGTRKKGEHCSRPCRNALDEGSTPTSRVTRAKEQLSVRLPGSVQVGDDWRASEAWKDQQRTGKEDAPSEDQSGSVKFFPGDGMLPELRRELSGFQI